jgi:hypothetical protein
MDELRDDMSLGEFVAWVNSIETKESEAEQQALAHFEATTRPARDQQDYGRTYFTRICSAWAGDFRKGARRRRTQVA